MADLATSRLNTLKAIVFDLDDTLYPQVSFKRSGFNAVSTWLVKNQALDQSTVLLKLDAILEQFGPSYPNMFDRLAERLDLKPNLVPQMVRVFIDHKPQIDCFEGVFSILSRLRRNYRLGILTDGRLSVQQNKIRALRLERSVDYILCSDSLGLEKPAVALFQWFENKFGLRGEQLMYVGDNPRKDFWGANQLGWETIHVLTGDGTNSVVSKGFAAKCSIPSVTDIEWLLQYPVKGNRD